jgi:hypothetical protein
MLKATGARQRGRPATEMIDMNTANIVDTIEMLPPRTSDVLARVYGPARRPIAATSVFRFELHPLDRNRITVERWAIINETSRTVTFVTTYNGRAGSRFNAARNTHRFDLFWVCRKLQDFHPVPIERCPVAAPDPVSPTDRNWRWLVS